jgi:ADP-ribosylglycohydrolase
VEALHIGLSEIPRGCTLAADIRWALNLAPKIKDYSQAREAVDKRFKGMHKVHTNNNACLTIWGLTIGGTDFSRVISETVAMGLDNDCTAATAGSIAGAVVGKGGIPARWCRKFNGKVLSYLNGRPSFKIDGLVKRFGRQAKKLLSR